MSQKGNLYETNAKKQPSSVMIAISIQIYNTLFIHYFILFIIYPNNSYIAVPTSTKCAQNYLIPKQCYMYFFCVCD